MQLHFYDERFKTLIDHYQITEDQLRFTGRPTDCIKLSATDIDRYSILAMEEDQVVTFFDLHKNEGAKPYSDNEHAIVIRSFSTDFRHLGKGYAKMALRLLPEFIRKHFREIDEIVLAVNVQNEVAQGLYKACGYIDEGERMMGPRGELIVMSYYL
ncbi:GNAT family N-acetyltransferase [Neobacillus jeddahensis]|uniref:GNAT family N-acetyltransferase n=1 Tax=Neobacillus jeddahensis TaxID=1461580 RepID=UPI00059145BF|nr:GNAT family protein [Neobacillus jeddahensis]